jgi:mono/diheme cytochrome c family protein
MRNASLRIATGTKRFLGVGALLVLITSSAPLQTKAQTAQAAAGEPDQHRAMLSTYCFTCHNTRVKIGGLALDGLDLEAPEENAQIWEKALRKLRGRLMPPPGNPQPPQKDIDSFVAWMENTLDSRAKGPKAGYVPIQRLNRTEYTASVKALLGVDVNAKDVLPQDIQAGGFDNIAVVLSVSPAFLDQYITAARQIAKVAVGNPNPSVSNVKYSFAANQGGDLPLPPGTRGGMRFKHNFPADGEYRINILNLSLGLYSATMENESTLVIMLDGRIVFRKPIGGPADQALVDRKGPAGRDEIMSRFTKIPVQVEAGVRDLVVAFIDRSHVESDENVATGFGGIGALGFGAGNGRIPSLADGVEIVGPYNPTGVSRTPSRALIFVCDPAERKPDRAKPQVAERKPDRAQPQVKNAGESACARKITENLARRAFRRPVTSEDVNQLMPFYEAGRRGAQARAERERDSAKPQETGEASIRGAQARQGEASIRGAQARQGEASIKERGSFDFGIEQVVTAVLASPEFLYRAIRGTRASSDAEVALTDLELASRLSFFLWNTGPDDELLTLAASGGLTKPGALEKQVKRMMADPKASSLVTSFAMKWLNIADLDAVKPDPMLFPEFNDQLRRDFSKEAEEFLSSILLEDRSVVDLLTADHTFLNERLARHYGISGVVGAQFRRVTLAEKERWGLLGKGAVLLRTSYGDRTSPVLRGAWVLDKLMGTPPSPPPPNVATNLDQKAGDTAKTIRARLEQHREKALCLQCHGVMDPIGLPLENFDAIGRWRTTDRQAEDAVIDASTVLPNGVAIDGPVELRAQLAGRPAMLAQALTERLMMYALNRELEYFDMPQVRAVVRGAAKDNYKFSSIVLGIVNTEAFRKQRVPPKAMAAK